MWLNKPGSGDTVCFRAMASTSKCPLAASFLGAAILAATVVSCQAEPELHQITVVVTDVAHSPVEGCLVSFSGDYAFNEVGRFTDRKGEAMGHAPNGHYTATATCGLATSGSQEFDIKTGATKVEVVAN